MALLLPLFPQINIACLQQQCEHVKWRYEPTGENHGNEISGEFSNGSVGMEIYENADKASFRARAFIDAKIEQRSGDQCSRCCSNESFESTSLLSNALSSISHRFSEHRVLCFFCARWHKTSRRTDQICALEEKFSVATNHTDRRIDRRTRTMRLRILQARV